jgi:hypothetical protein
MATSQEGTSQEGTSQEGTSKEGPSQQRLFEILLERVSTDRYPSLQLLDRLEEIIWTSEQVVAYVNALLEKIDESWYPSGQLLDRAQRMLSTAATMPSQTA